MICNIGMCCGDLNTNWWLYIIFSTLTKSIFSFVFETGFREITNVLFWNKRGYKKMYKGLTFSDILLLRILLF